MDETTRKCRQPVTDSLLKRALFANTLNNSNHKWEYPPTYDD